MTSPAPARQQDPTVHPPRIAGAPISWGVCEVPGWGHVLPVDRVLDEMASLGLSATELGPPGFLPEQADRLEAQLTSHDLALVGGFLALVLHDPVTRGTTLAEVERACSLLAGAGASVLVVAAATGLDGYDERPALDDAAWGVLVDTLDAVAAIAAGHGLTAAVHPHVGTHIETAPEVERFLVTSPLPLCLDTGHLLIGGTDPLALARSHGDRVAHVHLKDLDGSMAEKVRSGTTGYRQAVSAGLYRPLGQGDAGVADVVHALVAAGYDGWWVLEQDTALPFDQDAPVPTRARDPRRRPVRDTATSIAFLQAALSPKPFEKETP